MDSGRVATEKKPQIVEIKDPISLKNFSLKNLISQIMAKKSFSLPGGLGWPKLIQIMTANEDANPEIAPKELASGRHIPRVKRPSRGPPTIPKTERAAFRK
jgi:hypothetical protein